MDLRSVGPRRVPGAVLLPVGRAGADKKCSVGRGSVPPARGGSRVSPRQRGDERADRQNIAANTGRNDARERRTNARQLPKGPPDKAHGGERSAPRPDRSELSVVLSSTVRVRRDVSPSTVCSAEVISPSGRVFRPTFACRVRRLCSSTTVEEVRVTWEAMRCSWPALTWTTVTQPAGSTKRSATTLRLISRISAPRRLRHHGRRRGHRRTFSASVRCSRSATRPLRCCNSTTPGSSAMRPWAGSRGIRGRAPALPRPHWPRRSA